MIKSVVFLLMLITIAGCLKVDGKVEGSDAMVGNPNPTPTTPLVVSDLPSPFDGAGCASGEAIFWNGSSWACELPPPPPPLMLATSDLPSPFNGTGCVNGEILVWDGSAWSCELPAVPPAPVGDNLGNHIATQNLNLGAFSLVGNGGSLGILIANNGNTTIGNTDMSYLFHAWRPQPPTGTGLGVRIQGQTGGSAGGTGGETYLSSGNGFLAGNGGLLVLRSGNAGTNGTGGEVSILSGNSAGTGNGGPINISAGSGSGGAGGNGGTVTITAGRSFSSGGGGAGALILNGGIASGSSSNRTGGRIDVRPGTGAGDGAGGTLNLFGGTPGATGNGGVINIQSGVPIAGHGGNINMIASSGVGTNRNGGNIIIRPGDQTGTGLEGYINMDGRVGVGVLNPFESLEVNGNVLANNVMVPSDRRLKSNLNILANSLEKLKKVFGYSFTWNDKKPSKRGINDVGVIAQEVEAEFPELVTTYNKDKNDEYKVVNYQGLIAPVINSIHTLDEKIESRTADLEEQMALLIEENRKLRAEMVELKNKLNK